MFKKALYTSLLTLALTVPANAEQYVSEAAQYLADKGLVVGQEKNIYVQSNDNEISMRADIFLDVRDNPSIAQSVVINFPYDAQDPLTQALIGGELYTAPNGSLEERNLVNQVGGIDYFSLSPDNILDLENSLDAIIGIVPVEKESFGKLKSQF